VAGEDFSPAVVVLLHTECWAVIPGGAIFNFVIVLEDT
jgi:hypothetical protein